MPDPADDDKTIELRKPPSPRIPVRGAPRPAPASIAPFPSPPARRVPPWMIATPLALLTAAAVGGGIAWFRGPAENAPANVPANAPTRSLAQAPDGMAKEALAKGTAAGPSSATVAAPPSAAPPSVAPPSVTALALAPVEPPPAAVPARPEFSIETAGEQRILDHAGAGITFFRLSDNPRVLVVDFASLRDQGRMLNRLAAFVEKAGVPRDRVLNDADLDAVVLGGGETTETFYYGHDYGAESVNRFFRLADRDGIALRGEEEALRRLIIQEGWADPNARGALLSIPGAGSHERIDKAARAVILHHELSHGEYFTNPDYAAFVHRFWTQALTNGERERMRRHLRAQGYDSGIEELMENEAQAYLMFTHSPEYFTPAMIGMTRARLNELRAAFHRTMPRGWLRDSLGAFPNDGGKAAGAPVPP